MVDMFTPGKIGNVEIKNRIIRSATYEGLAGEDGIITDKLVAYIERLAEGGPGMVIVGATGITPEGRMDYRMAGMYSDEHVEGHSRLVEAAHQAGCAISAQLVHVGAQIDTRVAGGKGPVGASAVEHPLYKTTPRELSTDEVKQLVDDFGAAAAKSAKAGYDAIQIHGAHGYLVNQFMSPRFNKRNDEYGDPGRIVSEIYESVRANADGAMVHIKLNMDDFMEGSVTTDISMPIAESLSKAGIDAIEVSSGTQASGKLGPSRSKINGPEDEGFFLKFAQQVREKVDCTIITVGGYRSPGVINDVLGSGEVDFVAISRPMIREPELIKRWKEGDTGPATCISCNQCFKTVPFGEGVQCMIDYNERNKVLCI